MIRGMQDYACQIIGFAMAMSFAGVDYSWYHEDSLARELCKFTEEEFAKFTDSQLMDVSPVVLPYPESVVGINDYIDWPVATKVNDTIIILYDRRGCHFGCPDQSDSASGIRMIIRSTDGGKTWSEPFDLMSVGRWSTTPFSGWGGGLGAKDGVAYAALNRGLYKSTDEGETWELVKDPDFSRIPKDTHNPGMRLTFHPDKGLVIWTTDDYSDRDPEYGKILRAVYSPDYGQTWHYEDQPLPDGISFSELTPLEHNGKLIFFNRNGRNNTPQHYAQGWSETGWFPFQFALTNVYTESMDTPDVIHNPTTGRFEATASHRRGKGDGPQGQMKLNLYSMAPNDLFSGNANWRYEGTLVRYQAVIGIGCDGFNPVGSVIHDNKQYIYVWGGDANGKAGIFQYTRSLDTEAVRSYLMDFYRQP